MIVLAFILRGLGRVRALPLWLRLLSGLLLGVLALFCRTQLLGHQPSTARDMMLVFILVSGFCYGFWPGLVTGLTIRGLSLWWYVGPPEITLVRPWHDKGIIFFIVMATIGAAAAGRTFLILAEDRSGDEPPAPGSLKS